MIKILLSKFIKILPHDLKMKVEKNRHQKGVRKAYWSGVFGEVIRMFFIKSFLGFSKIFRVFKRFSEGH